MYSYFLSSFWGWNAPPHCYSILDGIFRITGVEQVCSFFVWCKKRLQCVKIPCLLRGLTWSCGFYEPSGWLRWMVWYSRSSQCSLTSFGTHSEAHEVGLKAGSTFFCPGMVQSRGSGKCCGVSGHRQLSSSDGWASSGASMLPVWIALRLVLHYFLKLLTRTQLQIIVRLLESLPSKLPLLKLLSWSLLLVEPKRRWPTTK